MDLFVSYAWTSPAHRQWVRLLCSSLHLLGYDVRVDQDVDYGNSLIGFMRTLDDARHVLLVVDENYVNRADNVSSSGVAIENEWIRHVFHQHPANWTSVVFVDNPTFQLPAWLSNHNPLSFDFNSSASTDNFPGAEQLDDLWRWVEGLPRDKTNAAPVSTQIARGARLERVDNLRDPGLRRNPAVEHEVDFVFGESVDSVFTLGQGDFEFPFQVSGCGFNSVYVYADRLHAVGLLRTPEEMAEPSDALLTAGRTVTPKVGQGVLLLNRHGALCTVRILEVQREINDVHGYVPARVRFAYTILLHR